MASAEDILERMRRSAFDHRESDYRKVLVYYGFAAKKKKARHGVFYRHAGLAASDDEHVRRVLSWMIVPNGCEDKDYLTDQVVERVEAAMNLNKDKTQ